jgi:hypothetical protein
MFFIRERKWNSEIGDLYCETAVYLNPKNTDITPKMEATCPSKS